MNNIPGRQQVRAWIRRSKQRQRDLARALGITEAYLSQALTGVRRPKLEILIEIERLTGVPVESWVDTAVSETDRDAVDAVNSPVSRRVK